MHSRVAERKKEPKPRNSGPRVPGRRQGRHPPSRRVKEGLTPRPPRAARYAKGPRSFARLRALYVFLSFSVPHQAFSVSESAREDGTAASFLITEPRDRRASAGQHRRRTDTVDVHILRLPRVDCGRRKKASRGRNSRKGGDGLGI